PSSVLAATRPRSRFSSWTPPPESPWEPPCACAATGTTPAPATAAARDTATIRVRFLGGLIEGAPCVRKPTGARRWGEGGARRSDLELKRFTESKAIDEPPLLSRRRSHRNPSRHCDREYRPTPAPPRRQRLR